MRPAPIRPAALFMTMATLLLTTLPTLADNVPTPPHPAKMFRLVNATFDGVTHVEVAPATGDTFEDTAIGEPLQGGLTSTHVRLPAGDCLRDFRVTYRDGYRQLLTRIDTCQSSGLRLTRRGST